MCKYADTYALLLEDDLRHLLTGSSHTSAKRYAAHAMLKGARKRLIASAAADADALALEKFVQSDVRSGQFRMPIPANSWDEELIGNFKKCVYNFFYPGGDPLVQSFDQIAARGSLGPGSNIGAEGREFYTKLFASNLTMTRESLYDIYRTVTCKNDTWARAENFRIKAGFKQKIVKASRLSFVPKNDDISRVIATEPTLNMFFQLGLGSILEERLKAVFGIHIAGDGFTQQDVNREMARIGSVNGCFSTIDLSSASDSISIELLEACIPASQLAWFKFFRCEGVTLPTGKYRKLGMFSTMGNGFTFPLQTVIFACIVQAVYMEQDRYFGRVPVDEMHRGGWLPIRGYGVFGDDIIVETEASRRVLHLLDLLGFIPNSAKTFVEGPFRESCGTDWFNGRLVRPVSVKGLDTPQARYVAINRLVEWSAYTRIPLRATIQWLLSTVRFLCVPPHAGYDAGIRVPFSMLDCVETVHPGTIKYSYWKVKTPHLNIGDFVVGNESMDMRVLYNPSGLLLAFLRSDVRNGKLATKVDNPVYQMSSKVTPCWDNLAPLPLGFSGWTLWEIAALTLLM